MKTPLLSLIAVSILVSACAGREPNPVQTVQAYDQHSDCVDIQTEIATNNNKIKALSAEESGKVVQNVAAGVAGLFIWPLWFAMDFQDAAGKEVAALENRNFYLTQIAAKKCGGAAGPEEVKWSRVQ